MKKYTHKFSGTGVAIVTPFKKSGAIDFTAFANLIKYQISNGVDYIVALGTTGEVATLNSDEKKTVIDFVIDTVAEKVPIVVGVGGNNTATVVKEVQQLEGKNIKGVLSVSPYYNKPQYKGLYEHYKHIAAATDLPIILYNVPGRTAWNMPAELTLDLAYDIENIVAVKEASGNLYQIGKIIANKPEDFQVISGDDQLTLPLIAMGAEGVISVTANLYPKQFSTMVNLALQGSFDQAKDIHYQLLDVMDALFMEGSPSGVKSALQEMGLIQNHVRLPLSKVSIATNNTIKKVLRNFEEKKLKKNNNL